MFVGNVQQHTIIADQPVLVVEGSSILSTFSNVQDAADFLARTRNETAFILRHNGSNWDIMTSRTGQSLQLQT